MDSTLRQSNSHDTTIDAQCFAQFPGFELICAKAQKMIANIVDLMNSFTTYVAAMAMAIKFPESVTEILIQLVIIKSMTDYIGGYTIPT